MIYRAMVAGTLALALQSVSTMAVTTPASVPAASAAIETPLIGPPPIAPAVATLPGAAPSDQSEDSLLAPVIIAAPEPRFVAPTRRDRIGRIWAPVFINGKGPFRLVLDSGASSSGITMHVVRELGLPLDPKRNIFLRGVIGKATVPLVRIHSFTVGDLSFGTTDLPIVADALGGADGILGTDGMSGRRILIDFHHDLITIGRSHDQRAPPDFMTIPFQLLRRDLIVVDAWVGNVRVKAVIDTGGQSTIANLALRAALDRQRAQLKSQPEKIEDVTTAVQSGDSADAPPILIYSTSNEHGVKINNDRITFGDMNIFEHWSMTQDPAMLVGMDTLGQLDMLIIDYKRHELQLRLNPD